MPEHSLTLMAVHAHPDDEAIGTGGILAKYSAQGVRTVLVTCTNGELGDGPGGVKPDDPSHDEGTVVTLRRQELEESCRVLGVTNLEMLGYHDTGMEGWPQNDAPDAFWHTPVDVAARRVADLMRTYRPQVVVTYDEHGFYGHPDHIQANRVTRAAIDQSGIPAKLYYTAIPRSRLRGFREMLVEHGIDVGDVPDEDADPEFGTPDELITTTIDCSAVADRKYKSLEAHASQGENIFFLQMGVDLFSSIMGSEQFVRVLDTTDAPVPEDDLFAGLR